MHKVLVGVLGIQGGFMQHVMAVETLGFKALVVKTAEDLKLADKLIIPGGESTAMRLMLKKHGLWQALQDFSRNKAVLGTCAGAILLAQAISDGEESLGAIDIDIKRNSYGRQIDSFTTNLELKLDNNITTVPAMFIRAPQITRVGNGVEVLADYDKLPVLVRANNVMVATFHPELTNNTTICEYFIRQL